MLKGKENKTAHVIDTAVPLTYNLPKNEAEKILKYENLFLVIYNIWKVKNVSIYTSGISEEGLISKSFLKYIQNVGSPEKISRVGQKQYCYNVSYRMQIPRSRPLILLVRMNCLALTEPNLTESLGIGEGFAAHRC